MTRQGTNRYTYHRYLCGSYNKYRAANPAGCGHFWVDVRRVQTWLVRKLQEVFLGPGREELVAAIQGELKADIKDSRADAKRLEKRLVGLDSEVTRLVKAIRTVDAPELLQELANARGQRDALKAELAQIGRRRFVRYWQQRFSAAKPPCLPERFW